MSDKLGQGKIIRAMYHPGNIVPLAVKYADSKELTASEIEDLFAYRKTFDPLPELRPFAWVQYLLASEYTARAFNLSW